MRSAATTARGTTISMKVAIITATRIWMRYAKKAVSEPTCISPASTRCPPNQITATLETLRIRMTTGNIAAIQRPTNSAMPARSRLTRPNRAVSNGSRTKARTTRMPMICSRMILFTASIRRCIALNAGITLMMTKPRHSIMAGTATISSQDSPASSLTAIATPPVIMMGALAIMVQAISTTICTCWTSLVQRVMSDGAPKWATSRLENVPTCRKTADRRSRPTPIAVRAPK